jgi:hypothetical protein
MDQYGDAYNSPEGANRGSRNPSDTHPERGDKKIPVPRQANIRGAQIERQSKVAQRIRATFLENLHAGVGAELLLQSWSKRSDSVVAASWDFSEKISDDEDSETSDEDCELRMTTDRDDEDVAMLHAGILEGEEEDE